MNSIEEHIMALVPSMTEEIAKKIKDRALGNLEHSVAQSVSTEVQRYVGEVVMPAVRLELEAHETEIKAAVLAAVKATWAKIGEAMVEYTTKKLASYDGDKLLQQMFGPLLRGY